MKRLNKKTLAIALFSTSLSLTGCGGAEKEAVDLTPVSPTTEQVSETIGSVVYSPSTSEIPYPIDVLFSGTEDGTLNIPIASGTDSGDPKYALNELDGFATSAPITVALTKEMDASTAPMAVRVFKVPLNASTKALDILDASGSTDQMKLATISELSHVDSTGAGDFMATTSGKKLIVFPMKPLAPASGYMVVVTNALKDDAGVAAKSGAVYNYLKSSSALVNSAGKSQVASLTDASATALEPLRQLTQLQLSAAVAVTATGTAISTDDVIASWTFSTQSIGTVLNTVTASVTNSSLVVGTTNASTSAVGGQGAADIYVGSLTVPYYLQKASTSDLTAPITGSWKGQTGASQTQYSVLAGDSPKKNEDAIIPVLMTVPNTNSGQTKPANGWPVVIFQHGITQNRTNALAIADAFAGEGYAVVAIDLPLHGVLATDSTASFKSPASSVERNFDLDYVTQNSETAAITAATPDGTVDTSGRHFVQLTSMLTTRDNMRQGISDLVQLKASLANATGIDLDDSKVSFVGHSLGGMVGAGFVKQATDLTAAVFAMSGTQAAYVLANSSRFGPEITAGLAAKGIEAGSADYASFIAAAQTAVDSGDPVNMVSAITVPTLMFKVTGDTTVPNSVSTAPLAGTDAWIRVQGLNTVTGTGAVTDGKGVLVFEEGDHASLLDTTSSVAVTTAMQQAMVSFVKSAGTEIQVTSDDTFDGEE